MAFWYSKVFWNYITLLTNLEFGISNGGALPIDIPSIKCDSCLTYLSKLLFLQINLGTLQIDFSKTNTNFLDHCKHIDMLC
jgi:hypothetical protein